MKICDIAQFYSPLSGGVKRYLLDKQRFLARRPDCRHVLIVPSHRTAATHTSSASIYEIKSPRLIGSRSYRLLISRRQIFDIVRRERPDLIEVGDPYCTAWFSLQAGRELQIPVMAFYHSDFPRAMNRTVRRFAGGWAGRIIAGPIQHYIVRLYNQMAATVVSSRRLCVVLDACGVRGIVHVPLGTDVHTFQPRPSRDRIRAELGLADGCRMLLFVGRMAREKNIRSLVGCLDHLPPEQVHLVLVGDGELHEFVQREADRRPNLTLLPYCESAQRLADLYSAADLFVHPGKYETFGIVALEAQACGAPVLVVHEGGVEDTVAGETPPIVARDGSAAGLAAAVQRFLRLDDTPERRTARRQRIEQHFTIDRTFERLLALYGHLIARRPIEEFPPEPALAYEVSRSSVSSR